MHLFKFTLSPAKILLMAIVCFTLALPKTTLSQTNSYQKSNTETYSNQNNFSSKKENLLLLKIKQMTLEEKVGQMFLVGIFANEANATLENFIRYLKIGSVLLMGTNLYNEKALNVTKTLQLVASTTHQLPLLIAIDQEGGVVTRMQELHSNLTSQTEITNKEQAYTIAKTRGKELKDDGIHINFSPVVEYITSTSSFMYNRVFRGSKENIISFGESMVHGYQDAGIISGIKHFPGHDNTSLDSHTNLPISEIASSSIPEYTRTFGKVIEKSNPKMVMMAHILFEKIDPIYPASLSPTFINILRGNNAYQGVIVTDDMNMSAITKSFGTENAAIQAIIAGNDILLYVINENNIITINHAREAIISSVKSGNISEKRIDESVYRILKLKEIIR